LTIRIVGSDGVSHKIDSRLSAQLVSLILLLSACFLGYTAMMSIGEPSAINGKVSVDSRVQFKQNDNVSYWFASDSYVNRLEIAPTYFEIDSLTMTTSVSTGDVNVTLYDVDPSDSFLKWRAEQDVSTASVTFNLGGLSAGRMYDWSIDDNVVAHTVCTSVGVIGYTFSGPWSSHVFIVQLSPGPPSSLQASFEYVIEGSMVTFKDKSYGGVSEWIWNFGDGKGSTAQDPMHKYSQPGTYQVSLTVYNAHGQSSTAKVSIELKGGPDFPLQQTPSGWNVYLANGTFVGVTATGLVASGLFLVISTYIYPGSIWIVTRNGRKLLGAIMLLAGLYFFIFIAKVFG